MLSVSHIVLAMYKGERAGVDDGCREEFSLPQMIFVFVSVLGLVKVAGLGILVVSSCFDFSEKSRLLAF